ncbi:MAG TPA: AAA family ATPase [Planctomycetota bacterium]|nr:AAA family ATPase [Planctomycetota bacterium]
MESASGDFQTLMLRPDIQIKVAERLGKLFKRDLTLEWSAGALLIKVSRGKAGEPYTAAYEASGLIQLIVILAALYDDDVGILLIDEPELSLHPQLQAFLLNELERAAGDPTTSRRKAIVISTHSTEMLRVLAPDDLTHLTFFQDADTDLVQIPPTAGELRDRKLSALIARLGQSHKAALFAQQPLLVEGPSDAVICHAVNVKLDLHIEATGCQIVPIIGKGQMPVMAKLMRLAGKKPIILADLDGFSDGLDLVGIFAAEPAATRAANEQGHSDLSAFARTVHTAFCQAVDRGWDQLAAIADKEPYWLTRSPGSDTEARRRAALAFLMKAQPHDLDRLEGENDWTGLKARLVALFDFMERAGCFILRRGTIESYYLVAKAVGEKPYAAAEEAASFASRATQDIRLAYADIVRCLEFASKHPDVDESGPIRRLVLSVVGPILHDAETIESDHELAASAKRVLGDKASIFKFALSPRDPEGKVSRTLTVDLSSSLLEVTGFPLTFRRDTNVLAEVEARVKPRK